MTHRDPHYRNGGPIPRPGPDDARVRRALAHERATLRTLFTDLAEIWGASPGWFKATSVLTSCACFALVTLIVVACIAAWR